MENCNLGWIKLYRVLLRKPIWLQSTPEQKTILIALLLMANHEAREWQWNDKTFRVNSGQFVTSLDSIIKKCGKGISKQNVRCALKRFKKYGFLTDEATNTGRCITIINWDLYQKENMPGNKDTDNNITNR